MEPQIISCEQMTLIGLEHYGPLSGEGWSAENTIGQLWGRFEQVIQKQFQPLEGKILNPEVAYELGIWNEEEFQATNNFYIFVGVEIDPAQLTGLPLEFVVRVLPSCTCARFTFEGQEIARWDTLVYQEWLPESDYQMATFHDYNFQVQVYEQGRFIGPDQLDESEIDVYVPVAPKA